MIDLGTLGLGGSFSEALDNNNQGQVVGWSLASDPLPHAFWWSEVEGMFDLGTLGGTLSVTHGINGRDQAARVAQQSDGHFRAVLWDVSGDLPNVTASDQSSAPSGVDSRSPGPELVRLLISGLGLSGLTNGERPYLTNSFHRPAGSGNR